MTKRPGTRSRPVISLGDRWARVGRSRVRDFRTHVTRGAATTVIATGALTLGLVGCSNDTPAVGVTQIDQAVVVAYKTCPGDGAAIETLSLFGSDDPTTPVWEARRTPEGIGVREMPIRSRFPGYAIEDRRIDETLDPGQRYSFEAVSSDEDQWGGPGFSVEDLEPGQVRVGGQLLTYAEWIDRPATCPEFTFVDVGLTGLVVAAVAGLFLVGLRLITRRFRRGDPDDPLRA